MTETIDDIERIKTALAVPNYMQHLPIVRLENVARDLYSELQLAKDAPTAGNTYAYLSNDCNTGYSGSGG